MISFQQRFKGKTGLMDKNGIQAVEHFQPVNKPTIIEQKQEPQEISESLSEKSNDKQIPELSFEHYNSQLDKYNNQIQELSFETFLKQPQKNITNKDIKKEQISNKYKTQKKQQQQSFRQYMIDIQKENNDKSILSENSASSQQTQNRQKQQYVNAFIKMELKQKDLGLIQEENEYEGFTIDDLKRQTDLEYLKMLESLNQQ